MADAEKKKLTLTEGALLRIRALVEGNGASPDAVSVLKSDEAIYTLTGTLYLVPSPVTVEQTYPGPARNPKAEALASREALRSQLSRPDGRVKGWQDAALQELSALPSKGWALDQHKIVLDQHTRFFCFTERCGTCEGRQRTPCPTCNGQGKSVCVYCQTHWHGRGWMDCEFCRATGVDPRPAAASAGAPTPCPECQGRRAVRCRYCHGQAERICSTCQGRGGIACTACKATGQITTEAKQMFGLSLHFKPGSGIDLPQKLRRLLGRVGTAGIANGHAIITHGKPENVDGGGASLAYTATLPFAEAVFKIGDGQYPALLVGERHAIVDAPPFLDALLAPAGAALAAAAQGKGSLKPALEARLIREALVGVMGGRYGAADLRKTYAAGLSKEMGERIVRDAHDTLRRQTLWVRSGLLFFSLSVSVLCAFMYFHTRLYEHALPSLAPAVLSFLLDTGLLASLLYFVRYVLRRGTGYALRFLLPELPRPKGGIAVSGKLTIFGMSVLVLLYLLLLWFYPPPWLLALWGWIR